MGLLVQSWNVIKGSSQSQICWFWTVWQVPRPLQWMSSLHSNARKKNILIDTKKNIQSYSTLTGLLPVQSNSSSVSHPGLQSHSPFLQMPLLLQSISLEQ